MPATISIIIPAYNAAATIAETIASVLAQSFQDWELIIVNDGSLDNTLEVVGQFQDDRIQVFSYPNARQATSRNRGIAKSTGEYLSFLDADDLWSPDKLAAQYQALQSHPQAGVAYSWTNCIDSQGNFVRRGSHTSVQGNVYAALLLVDFIESGSNPLVRRSLLEQVGGFDPDLGAAEDWDLWIRLAAQTEFVPVSQPQIFYRLRANSWSADFLKQHYGGRRVIEQSFQRAPAPLRHLKFASLGNLYKGSLCRCLESQHPRRGWIALGLLGQCLRYDPVLIRARVVPKVLIKSLILLLPSFLARPVLKYLAARLNTMTLLGYLRWPG